MAATEPVVVARDDLPFIAPIRTKALAGAAATAAETGTEESSAPECSTPTSEDQKLKAPLVCPPAPRKPRCNKRKLPAATTTTTPVNFYVVTRDLSAVFRSLPPKKRIRVAG